MNSEAVKDFLEVPVASLRGDAQITFDLFVRIGGRFVLFCRKGDSFEGQRLRRLRQKRVKNLFVRSEDFAAFEAYRDGNVDSAFDLKVGVDLRFRMEILQGFFQMAAQSLMQTPDNPIVYQETKINLARYADLLDQSPGSFSHLMAIPNVDSDVGQHGVATATLALLLARRLNFQESQPLDVLALGALIHDIEHAHRTLPLGTPPGKLSEEQRQIYLQHPTEGVERVRRLPFYDPTVMAIIAQHEESMDGSGFPRQITERELAPGVLCVALANRYDRAVGLEMGEPRAAVKTMLIEQMGRIPLPFLEALQGLLKSEGII